MSIYYHALRQRDGLPAPEREKLPPIAVPRAAQILADDTSADRVSRHRRAIAVLVGSSTIGKTFEEWSPVEFRNAIAQLGGPALLDAISHAWFSALDTPRCQGSDPMDQEQLAFNVLNSGGNLMPACCTCLADFDIDPPPDDTSVAMAFFNITVYRPKSEVHATMDPRCWTSCNPDFFYATHIVADCTGGDLTEVEILKACGEGGVSGVLYEQVAYTPTLVSCPDPDLKFQNLIDVKTVLDANGDYRTDYDLRKSMKSKIPCAAEVNGGLDVDCGCAFTGNALGGTVMQGVKYLKFADPTLVNWTVVGLRAMVDAIREVGVCCGATPPITCEWCKDPGQNETVQPECANCVQ